MLFLMLMCSCSTERNNAEKEEGTKSESENYSDDSYISEALSDLKLIPSDVSDSNGINLSEAKKHFVCWENVTVRKVIF